MVEKKAICIILLTSCFAACPFQTSMYTIFWWLLFGKKPLPDQDETNKKKFSQIGPAVPEEIGHKQTERHANIVLLYKRDISKQMYLDLDEKSEPINHKLFF